MRVLVVSRRYPPDEFSGTETVISNVVERAGAEHEVLLVAGWRRDPSLLPDDAVRVRLRGLPRPAAWAAMARAARRAARSFRPDVVLGNSIETPTGLAPTVIIVYDFNFGSSRRLATARLREAFYRRRSGRLARVVVISEATRIEAVRRGFDPGRLAVIHPGVDTERLRPPDGAERDDHPGRPAVLAYPSRFIPGKGQHLAIEAFRRLCADRPGAAVLDLVGAASDPAYLADLRRRAEGLDVRFHTDVPDMAPYYRRADVILFPTLMAEGFGYTLAEGMACGRPVVHFHDPAVTEAAGGCAVGVTPGDAGEMARAARALLDDPARRRALGRAGRERVLTHYSWEAVWRAYREVLARAAEGVA